MELIDVFTKGIKPMVGDITDKVCVIRPTGLNKRYQSPRFQLFKATGGFGCKPENGGSKVFGFYLADSEEDTRHRYDFIGLASEELIDAALKDATAVKPIDTSEVGYLVISNNQHWAIGSSISDAKSKLSSIGGRGISQCFLCHPESRVDEMGYVSYPKGTQLTELKI